MVSRDSRFVYGRFQYPGRKEPGADSTKSTVPLLLQVVTHTDRVAIEVMREFSATEFIGKLYLWGSGGSWVLAETTLIQRQGWFTSYTRIPKEARLGGKLFWFEMEGSGVWKVLYIRNESDETGPYIAVALKYD